MIPKKQPEKTPSGRTFTVLNGAVTLSRWPGQRNPAEDALWLADFLPSLPPHAHLLDVGCGSGIVSLAYLSRFSKFLNSQKPRITGLEICSERVSWARANAALNGADNGFDCVKGDISTPPFAPRHFDHVFSNLPFHLMEEGFSSKSPSQQNAHGIQASMVEKWIQAMLSLTKSGGGVSLVSHTKLLPIIKAACKGHTVHITPVQTHPTRAAKRVLVGVGIDEGL